MEKVLIVGTNTRPVVCSAKKLGYTVFSVDYFCTFDLRRCSSYLKCVLSQNPYESCGRFPDEFDPFHLEKLASDFIDEVDFVLCSSGVRPENFPTSMVMGNRKVEDIDNKYKLFKRLEGKFKVPKTFLVSDFSEAKEIADNFPAKKFILKPVVGFGGIGINDFNDQDKGSRFEDMMLQELIKGENISASLLSTGDVAQTILTGEQLLGEPELGQKEKFAYCGNITPYPDDIQINKIAEDVILDLSLVGSNGVDMIYDGKDIYVVEVNPRFQGTFECAEAVLGINMVEAHIEACRGTLIKTPRPKKFAVKMLVFAKQRSLVDDLNFRDVFDIPQRNVIIEEGEPMVTVLKTGRVLEDAIYSAERTVQKVYDSIIYYPK